MNAFLSRFTDLCKIESDNSCYYNAKSRSYHLKRSDVWFEFILCGAFIFSSFFSLFCAINMSLLLGTLTFLLGSSFSCLLFLIKLLVTGELADGYSNSKKYFQEEIDYKISAEICKSKSKIYATAVSALNRIFSDEGYVESDCLDKKVTRYDSDKLIDSEVDEFSNYYSQCSLSQLNIEHNFINKRLEMLYNQLNVDVCRKVMYKKLKIRLTHLENNSFGFEPKDQSDFEVMKRLVFYLPGKYKVNFDCFDRGWPLDLFQAVSNINYKIREIAILEIRMVLVEVYLADDSERATLDSVMFNSISPTKGLRATDKSSSDRPGFNPPKALKKVAI